MRATVLVLAGLLLTGCSDEGGNDVLPGVLVRQSTATQSGDVAVGVVDVRGDRAVLTVARTGSTPREEEDVTVRLGESAEVLGHRVEVTEIEGDSVRLVVEPAG